MRELTSLVYKNFLRPVLFKIDPEKVHDMFTSVGVFLGNSETTRNMFSNLYDYKHAMLKQKLFDINFDSPIGLSEGFDKDANLLNILPSLGFGFTQVGTVTLNPYEGNPKPRLTRLPKQKGLVVYYGLKNLGAHKIIKKLKNKHFSFPFSVSIGKTNAEYTSKPEAGIKDYVACLDLFNKANVGDFYTLNISCPNTFGGEPFTNQKDLTALLKEVSKLKVEKPIFVKMPINLAWADFEPLLKIIIKFKLSGVIIGNLNKEATPKGMKGGVSGLPTWKLSNDLIKKTYKAYGDKLKIIGVGGVFSGADAYEKIKLGASLVQLITGMIYVGPQLIGQINKDLVRLLKRDGFKNISEAVGSSN